MAERVVDEVGRMDEPRLRQGDDERQDALIADVLEDALEAGQASVLKGPELLPALADAGVVDAGGYGLTIIFAGVIAALRGADAPDLDHHAPARVTHPEHESSTFRYCTNFAVTGTELAAAQTFRPALEAIGDSVLVVGDHRTLKVHVHTDDPDRATAIFEALGEVSRLDIADMHAQVAARTERLEASRQTCGVLAVVSGSGMAQEFGDLQVTVLDGGRTMNPSTTEILARLHAVPAEEVIVLPNSPNVVMAAEAAAQLSEKRVVVVPSRSQQAGLALAYLLRPDAGAEENAAAMQAELATLRTASVAVAARDDAGARFRRGEAIGYVDDELVAWGAPDQTLSAVLEDLAKDASSVVVYAADDAPLDEDAVSALAPEGLELDQLYGGQPSYWWLLSTE
jgi:dihydroxyacetone kinase-like predicted kinase